MTKKIEDYATFYLGCEVVGQYNGSDRKGYLTGITNGGTECEIQFFEEDGFNVFEEPEFNLIDEVKLSLRPFSDMTDEEYAELSEIKEYYPKSKFVHMTLGESTRWMLSKRFDVFGLIDVGLVNDATKLSPIPSTPSTNK